MPSDDEGRQNHISDSGNMGVACETRHPAVSLIQRRGER